MLQGLNLLDFFILIVMGVSILIGFIHGFIRSLLSVLVWAGAVVVATIYGPHLATTFSLVTSDPTWQLWLSYGLVFLVAVVIGFIIKMILRLILDASGIGFFDRLAGAFFGLARGILIVSLFLWFSLLVGMNQDQLYRSSRLLPLFNGMLVLLESWFPSVGQTLANAAAAVTNNPKYQAAGQALNQGKTIVNQVSKQVLQQVNH
jgi:membrane protein required for colicin V production